MWWDEDLTDQEFLAYLEALDEALWDYQFANSQDALAKLAEQALAEYREEKTVELDLDELMQLSGEAVTDTPVEDPLAHLSDKDRAAHIQQRLAGMDAKTRKGLAHSRGKWTRDND